MHLVDFLLFISGGRGGGGGGAAFVTFCLLSCVLGPFCSKMKENLHPLWGKFFSFRVDPFSEVSAQIWQLPPCSGSIPLNLHVHIDLFIFLHKTCFGKSLKETCKVSICKLLLMSTHSLHVCFYGEIWKKKEHVILIYLSCLFEATYCLKDTANLPSPPPCTAPPHPTKKKKKIYCCMYFWACLLLNSASPIWGILVICIDFNVSSVQVSMFLILSLSSNFYGYRFPCS